MHIKRATRLEFLAQTVEWFALIVLEVAQVGWFFYLSLWSFVEMVDL